MNPPKGANRPGAGLVRWLLWAEAGLALVLAWLLVFVLPIRWTGRLFGTPRVPEAAAAPLPGHDLDRARVAVRRLARVAARLPWRSTCLVRAVAGKLLLARRAIAGGVVRIGVRKREGNLEAHAWLLLGDMVLLGGEEAEGYRPLADMGRLT